MGGKRWTTFEDSTLISSNRKGKNYKEISLELENRTMFACQSRGFKLGLDGQNNNADIEFFLKDSREMYYVLGYWYADGGIYYKSGGTYFDIASIDREQIEKIKNLMGIKTSILEDKTNNKTSYRIMVGNKSLVENLMSRFEVMFRKTTEIVINKDKIPIEFFYDFLRGYFDGDGSLIFSSRLKNNGERPLSGVKFTGSKNIIYSLFDILSEKYKCTLYEDKRGSKSNCWYLGVYGESSRRLLNKLYDNPTIFLQRKYLKYLESCI